MSSSVPEAIRHVVAEPGTMPSNHVWSEQFDIEAAVVLKKCAEKILFVPPPSFAEPVRGILKAIKDVMEMNQYSGI